MNTEYLRMQKLAGLLKEYGTIPVTGKPGHNLPLRIGKEYQLLDPGTNEYSDGWEYLGELAMGSSAGNAGDHMFKADDAPGAFVFVAVSNEDLKKEFVRTVGYDSKNIR